MSRSSSGSGLRGGRVGVGWDELVLELGDVLGPLVGQECWVVGAVGEAGVCGAWCGDCWPDCTVRTGSPGCGRAEFVVPTPGRPSFWVGTGTVSSVGAGGFAN